jgi:hypothetical protein
MPARAPGVRLANLTLAWRPEIQHVADAHHEQPARARTLQVRVASDKFSTFVGYLQLPDIGCDTITIFKAERARAKLKCLASATDLSDLVMPPSNQLEALRGHRQGQHGIRVNKQCRVRLT